MLGVSTVDNVKTGSNCHSVTVLVILIQILSQIHRFNQIDFVLVFFLLLQMLSQVRVSDCVATFILIHFKIDKLNENVGCNLSHHSNHHLNGDAIDGV